MWLRSLGFRSNHEMPAGSSLTSNDSMESAYIASHLHDGPHLEISVVEDDCVEEFTESADGVTEPKINNKRKQNLTECERWAIYEFLLVRKKNPQDMDNFDLVHGALSDTVAKFNVTRPAVSASGSVPKSHVN